VNNGGSHGWGWERVGYGGFLQRVYRVGGIYRVEVWGKGK
jgi:hypothetical protein